MHDTRTPEQRQAADSNRYHWLVDESFLRKLTPEEAAEMERLGQEIDQRYAPYYERVLRNISASAQPKPAGEE